MIRMSNVARHSRAQIKYYTKSNMKYVLNKFWLACRKILCDKFRHAVSQGLTTLGQENGAQF